MKTRQRLKLLPSTRKQKAEEGRSKQLDIMSDVQKVDIMLGSYSRDDEPNDQSESEVKLESDSIRLQQNSNSVGEDSRSLLNTNSSENSEMIIETTRMNSTVKKCLIKCLGNSMRSNLA